ncbi:hypothetical protein CW745_15065 [Psychromonas sp. psych-6C06]|nr:hypothetical protein CW745_15065 [Psychromonas sp. psych-6C06]
MQQLGVIQAEAPVQCERLREVRFDYIDFQGKVHRDGSLVVMDAVAPYVSAIFKQLYEIQFPIHQAKPIEHYHGDDKRSMADNNSSAFNYRALTGKRSLSLHAYGLAIDINPQQNPFIEFNAQGMAKFSPLGSEKYANRMRWRLAKQSRMGFAEQVIDIFADNGFLYWGGYWDTPIDYQHFQVSRDMATLMTTLSAPDAKQFFENYVNWHRSCKAMYPLAYSQHRVNDYVHYLKNSLSVKSLTQHYQLKPQAILAALNRPAKRSAICVKQY